MIEQLFIKCSYCEKPLPKGKRTIDHFIPLSKGGKDSKENRLWACANCNRNKADKMPNTWLNNLQDRNKENDKLNTIIKNLKLLIDAGK